MSFHNFKIDKDQISFYDINDEGDLKIIPPLMREEVLTKESTINNFILVYLCNEGYLENIKQEISGKEKIV